MTHQLALEFLDRCVAAGVIPKNKLSSPPPDTTPERYLRTFLAQFGLRFFPAFGEMLRFSLFEDATHKRICASLQDTKEMVTFICIPRGNWKSHLYGAGHELWEYLRWSILHKKTPATALCHGDLTKALELKDLVFQYSQMPLIQYLYGQYLIPLKNNENELQFESSASDVRKDPHFKVLSVDSDWTGLHPSRILIDDMVTRKNCLTVEGRAKIKDFFNQLLSLEDHFHSEQQEFVILGTLYAKDTIYTELMTSPKWDKYVNQIVVPASQLDPLSGEEVFNFPKSLPKEKLERYKHTMPSFQYYSQYYAIEYDPEGTLAFNATLPEFSLPLLSDVLHTFLLIDPSISNKNKTSRMTMQVVQVTRNKEIFVIDGFSSVGTTPTKAKEQIFYFAQRYGIDMLIVETVAFQEYFRQDIEDEKIKRLRDGTLTKNFFCIPHTHRENKRIHYRSFLEPLLTSNKIYVNPRLAMLVEQLTGQSVLEDEVDCLSFLKEAKLNYYEETQQPAKKNTRNIDICRKYGDNRPRFGIVTGWI